MKHRNGFVSNSSSSSFIVQFEEIPKTIDELRTMMNPKKENYCEWDYVVTAEHAIQLLWNEMKDQVKDFYSSDPEEVVNNIVEQLKSDHWKFEGKIDDKYLDLVRWHDDIEEEDYWFVARKIANKFINAKKVVFTFGDEWEAGAVMEKGEIIRESGLPFEYENHH